MRRLLHVISVSTSLALVATQLPQASACGFDGAMSDSFSASHPKSLDVAFAISDAVGKGIVKPLPASPSKAGQAGYWKAQERVSRFQTYLPASASGTQNVSLLLVDSQLWSRFKAAGAGYEMVAHAEGAAAGDVVVITAEPVIAMILDGQLTVKAALDTGVLAIEGETDAVRNVTSAMLLAANQPLTRPLRLFMPGKPSAQPPL